MGKQIFELERSFEAKKYLSSAERAELALSLAVTQQQVKVTQQQVKDTQHQTEQLKIVLVNKRPDRKFENLQNKGEAIAHF